MNKEVNFKIAKLLKEKGFNEEVRDYYGEKDGVFYHSQYYRDNISINEKHKGFVTAPTIAEVVMWLYEKHGIWISVDIGMTGFYGHYKVNPQNTLPSNLKQGWANDQDNPAKSITEAYEAAIKYVLKDLI